MRITKASDGSLQVWLSAADTEEWAERPGESWPCSQLNGRSVFAEFDSDGDLVDMTVDSGRGDQDIDGTEFNACLSDHIALRYPDHPAIR